MYGSTTQEEEKYYFPHDLQNKLKKFIEQMYYFQIEYLILDTFYYYFNLKIYNRYVY